MGTAKEQRAAATRERRRKEQRVRAEARATELRSARKAAAAGSDPNPLRIPWPLACRWEATEAWLSEAADGASHHHLGLVRSEGDSRAAVFWRADAATGVVDDIVRLSGVNEDRVNAEIVRRAQERPLMSAEPEDAVAGWIDASLLRGRAAAAPEYAHVERFLAGLDADEAITRLTWGTADASANAAPAPRRSWWARLLGG